MPHDLFQLLVSFEFKRVNYETNYDVSILKAGIRVRSSDRSLVGASSMIYRESSFICWKNVNRKFLFSSGLLAMASLTKFDGSYLCSC